MWCNRYQPHLRHYLSREKAIQSQLSKQVSRKANKAVQNTPSSYICLRRHCSAVTWTTRGVFRLNITLMASAYHKVILDFRGRFHGITTKRCSELIHVKLQAYHVCCRTLKLRKAKINYKNVPCHTQDWCTNHAFVFYSRKSLFESPPSYCYS